jgi:hypothetical protein
MTALLRRRTPLAAVARGLLAGTVGTAAMTTWQELAARLQARQSPDQDDGDAHDASRRESGDESAWEQASAPAQVARRIAEGVFDVRVPATLIPVLTHATHWAYGIGWGGVYGVLRDSADSRGVREGLMFGTGVWTMSYVQLVPMGLYEPPWKYPPKEVVLDLSYHLVYGAGVAAGYQLLTSSQR